MKYPVSVIIVNYNGGPLLAESVRSVLQSTVPVEVLVSDNASTDASLIELRLACGADERLTILENPANLGFAKANNLALAVSRHEYILFLNPDCIVEPDTLERMLNLFETDARIGMAGCLIRNPDGTEQPGCRRSIPTPWRTFVKISGLDRLGHLDSRLQSYLHTALPLPAQAASVEAISGAFMLVRRSALEDVGPMDEGYFMHFEDLDWCLRFQQRGWAVMFEPAVEILHVGGVCTATRPLAVEYHKHRGMARFYRKFFNSNQSLLLNLLIIPAVYGRFLGRVGVYALARLRILPSRESREKASMLATELSGKNQPPVPAAPVKRVLVTGATSLIGDYLLPGLVNAGYELHAVSRNPPDYGSQSGIHWHTADIGAGIPQSVPRCDILIHLAPLATLPVLLEAFGQEGPKRVIGFGSTSVFTKASSALESERRLASGLKEAEKRISELASSYGFAWTVFRPTLVYHLGRDKNVTTIATFLRKFGFFPLVNGSLGKRQPVHAEDLAEATLNAIGNAESFGMAYNLCGGETLTYKDMVKRIARAIGRESKLIDIPLPLLKAVIRVVSVLPRFRHLNPEMATRISQNMCFDNTPAATDLAYAPRKFLESVTLR